MIDAGFQVLAAVELDANAAKTLKRNCRSVSVIQADIRHVDASDLRKKLRIRRGSLDLLKACPPCQGWSTLGNTDINDPRNDLISEIARFVKEFQPKAVLLENVPGLTNDDRFVSFVRVLRRAGYSVGVYLADALDFGVPQHRRRLIALA
ncbi:MAG: DNA cytosine methyltransferase, partial [bacterium]